MTRSHSTPRSPSPSLLSLLALATLLAAATLAGAQDGLIASWSFDEGGGQKAADAAGKADGRIVKAQWSEGKSGSALSFEDYSLIDYLKPDVTKATRVVVAHQPALNPPDGFSVRATVFPTRDPLYYGGIVEKGTGLEASYRLVLLRGLKVRAAVGGSRTTVTSEAPISTGEWHDLEMRFEKGLLTLLVDGKEAGRAEIKEAKIDSTADLVIGERFSGKIDGVEIGRR